MAIDTKRMRNKTIFSQLKIQLPHTSELTTMLIANVNLETYYHKFNIIEDPPYHCGGGSQTA